MKESIKKWLRTKSEFYSKICEFEVTRGMVIRTNLIVIVFVAFVKVDAEVNELFQLGRGRLDNTDFYSHIL